MILYSSSTKREEHERAAAYRYTSRLILASHIQVCTYFNCPLSRQSKRTSVTNRRKNSQNSVTKNHAKKKKKCNCFRNRHESDESTQLKNSKHSREVTAPCRLWHRVPIPITRAERQQQALKTMIIICDASRNPPPPPRQSACCPRRTHPTVPSTAMRRKNVQHKIFAVCVPVVYHIYDTITSTSSPVFFS